MYEYSYNLLFVQSSFFQTAENADRLKLFYLYSSFWKWVIFK